MVRELSEAMTADDPFWRLGQWEFMLHDAGWLLAYRRVVRCQGRWPTWQTFHR